MDDSVRSKPERHQQEWHSNLPGPHHHFVAGIVWSFESSPSDFLVEPYMQEEHMRTLQQTAIGHSLGVATPTQVRLKLLEQCWN